MDAFVEALDVDTRPRRERQGVVARLEHHPGRDLDLFAGIHVVVGQVLHAQRRELDVVDPQAAFVALGKVDHHLRLGEDLHGVGNRRDSLDRVREAD